MKGRIVVLKEYRKPFEIAEYDVPDPEPGDVLLKITQAGICGTDLHVWRGDTEGWPLPPEGRTMGHEGTGVVYKLGKGVTTDSAGVPIKEGDRVIHSLGTHCGSCRMCLNGEANLCIGQRGAPPGVGEWPYFVGTYADYFYVHPQRSLYRVPDEIDDEVLGPVNCAMGTATQGLIQGRVGHGSSVVIQGAGGLGLTAIAMAKDMGAYNVIVLDRLENRLQLAEEFGADHTINIEEFNTPETRVQRVKDLTGGLGADAVIELVGRSELLPEGVAMLRKGGTFVEIGLYFPGHTVTFDASTLVLTGKHIVGSVAYTPDVIPRLLDFLSRSQDTVPFKKMVSHRFKLDEVNQAFEQAEWDARQTAVTRAVLVP